MSETFSWVDPQESYWLNTFYTEYEQMANREDTNEPTDYLFPALDKVALLTDVFGGNIPVEVLTFADFRDTHERIDNSNALQLQLDSFGTITRPVVLKGTNQWVRDGVPDYYMITNYGVFEFCEEKGIECECLVIPFENYIATQSVS